MSVPNEYQLICKGCGETLDMRDAGILSHGWIESGKIVCYNDVDVPYSSSKKVGEPILWTKDKNRIDLN